MRLKVAIGKEILNKILAPSTQNIEVKQRVGRHRIVASTDLINIWKEEAEKKGLMPLYMSWFQNVILTPSFEKIDCTKYIERNEGEKLGEEQILIAIGKASKYVVVVGDIKSNIKSLNRDIIFVSINAFSKKNEQIIELNDIVNLFSNKQYEKIFNIFETPISINVSRNLDADILSRYLAIFYNDSDKIIIKDEYLDQISNTENLDKYILPNIDKTRTSIEFQVHWDQHTRQNFIKFNNYKGYKSSVRNIPKEFAHGSYIESDKYKIFLGYRMKIFGSNGKTENETITIHRKNSSAD